MPLCALDGGMIIFFKCMSCPVVVMPGRGVAASMRLVKASEAILYVCCSREYGVVNGRKARGHLIFER